MSQRLDCNGRLLDLGHPQVMGVLNITPDSFSDGGRCLDPGAALESAREMVEAGAAIIDIGGESTRPGATPVPENLELERVIPVVELLAAELTVPLSVDTMKPRVMQAAVAAGAGLINDVYALRSEGALETAAELGVPVCLMHMQGDPQTMQQQPRYNDVVADVAEFLAERVAACEEAGIARGRIILDPGFGFGKTADHNLSLLKGLGAITRLGFPVLAGLSRKSLIQHVLGRPLEARLAGSVALATMAAWQGAGIIRAHDVRETVDAVRLADAVRNAD